MGSNGKKSRNILNLLFLTLVVTLPLWPAMGFPPFAEVDARLFSSRLERGLAVFFALAAVFYFIISFIRKEEAPLGEIPATGFRLFLPALPWLFYLIYFTNSAYTGLFLSDYDFTGMSESFNRTAGGLGLLETPYFHTGESSSYLGHHFAPTLVLFAPVYFIATALSSSVTHLLYGWLLVFLAAAALWNWAGYFARENLDGRGALFAFAGLLLAYPLQRIALSFHFELLTLLFGGLCFRALKEKRALLFWLAFAAWLGLKEDMGVYLSFFGLYLFSYKEHRSKGWKILLIAPLYFYLATGPLREYFTGGSGMSWDYFAGFRERGLDFGPLIGLLGAFAFLPVLGGRLFWLVVLPLGLLQLFSGHAWHRSFYGHYAYTILPFVIPAFLAGFNRLNDFRGRGRLFYFPAAALSLALILYSAAGERETPLPLFAENERIAGIRELVAKIPAGSCVQSMSVASPHLPLSMQAYPLDINSNNPEHRRMPPRGLPSAERCAAYYLLLDPAFPWPPGNSKTILEQMEAYAKLNLQEVARSGSLILYKKR